MQNYTLNFLFMHVALKGMLSNKDLNAISKEVNGDCRSFLTHLGVRATKIRTLREKLKHDPVKICLHGLDFWRKGNQPCRPATLPILCEALEKGAERGEYARELRKYIASKANKKCSQGLYFIGHILTYIIRYTVCYHEGRSIIHPLSRIIQECTVWFCMTLSFPKYCTHSFLKA